MTRIDAVLAMFVDLDGAELRGWIERRWVQPDADERGEWIFHEIDLARVRLIYDLRREFETSEETVPLVLSLLDQVYELRGALKAVAGALSGLPPDVQEAVRKALRRDEPPG
jgi:chaperone modulatory protein CbpM